MNRGTRSCSAKRRRGATVVETAICIPFFFLLVFGLVEFARMGMAKQALADAARAGCRKAVLVTTINQADAEKTVRNHLQATMANADDTDKCRVTISPASFSGMASGTEITTSVEVNYSDVSWIPPTFLKKVVLRGESTMKRE